MKQKVQLGITLYCLIGLISLVESFARTNRFVASLPSVSDDHYQESRRDGSYRFAYTGDNSYRAERRLADGTVEGETLYVRPDGVPVKVHYFADAKGYRPQTEVLYSERIRTVGVPSSEPTVYLAPPSEPPPAVAIPVPVPVPDGSVNARIEGNTINIGSNGFRSGGEDVAVASPTITAIVGPGGRAELRPDTYARSGRNGVAISNPTLNSVVGPGGSVVIAPTTRASSNSDPEIINVPSEPIHARAVLSQPAVVLSAAPPPPLHHVPVHSPDVLLVPARNSYEYTYSYSAPDNNHPHRDNSAFVNVRVN